MKKYLPSDDWMNSSGIAFPLYRLTGGNVNFDKLLKLGIPGLRKEIELHAEKSDEETKSFYEGSLIALDVLNSVFDFYIEQSKGLSSQTDDADWKSELYNISNTLEAIKISAPVFRSFFSYKEKQNTDCSFLNSSSVGNSFYHSDLFITSQFELRNLILVLKHREHPEELPRKE